MRVYHKLLKEIQNGIAHDMPGTEERRATIRMMRLDPIKLNKDYSKKMRKLEYVVNPLMCKSTIPDLLHKQKKELPVKLMKFSVTQEPKFLVEDESDQSAIYLDLDLDEDNFKTENKKLMVNKTWTPVSIVITTKIEHHDIFKEILTSLFDLIRKPH